MRKCRAIAGSFLVSLVLTQSATLAIDAVDRLTAERLEAVHGAIARFKSERQELPRLGSLKEYRANLHVHSAFSHDSRGKIDEIVKAAKAAGTSVLMFTEHPTAAYDFFKDGHQGLHDDVLLIPGAEMKGLLVFPRQSVGGLDAGPVQEFSDIVRARQGLIFVSHLEERMDWKLGGITGVEIYNTHADVKDEKRLAANLRNPLWLLKAAELFGKYPQESFSALQNYPADYLRRWDELCAMFPHTGVSANDSHQNIGLTVRLADGGKARVEDALGEKLIELDAQALTAVLPKPAAGEADDVLFQMRLDPYENSLRHVATHLLMPELSQPAVWDALEKGRAFVAFDWIADATGFDLTLDLTGKRHEMGSSVTPAEGLRLVGQAPLPARWRIIRNGALFSEAQGANLDLTLTEPGRYRAELWLDVAGEEQIWILTNPFYVTAK